MVKGLNIVGMETLFRKEYDAAVAAYSNTNAWEGVADVGMEIPSTGSEETYRWLQENPEFEIWIGDLKADDLAEYSYAIKNEPFAAAIDVHEDEIEDDKDDVIIRRIQGMAGGDKRKWGKMLHTLLVNGTTNPAFDGVAFFADAGGSRVNDNLLAGTISASAPTVAQVLADVDMVIQAMGAFKNTRGELVGIVPDTFVVSLKAFTVFTRALLSPTDATNPNAKVANPFAGMKLRIVVDPGLQDANDFYALATRYPIGALVKQVRSPVESRIDETHRDKNGRLTFLCKFRGNAGYGLPIMAAKVVSSAA